MTYRKDKKTVKYNKLRERKKNVGAVDHNYHGKTKVYESDIFAFKRKLKARGKIERILEEKMLEEL